MLRTFPGKAMALGMAGSRTAVGGGTAGSSDATGALFVRAATAGFFFIGIFFIGISVGGVTAAG
jgi:hypothetical protein